MVERWLEGPGPSMTGRVALAACLCALLFAGTAQARPGDVYVADEDTLGGSGAIFRIGPAGGDAQTLSSGGAFSDPGGIAWSRNGRLLVADGDADTIFRVHPRTGARSVVASGGMIDSPEDLAMGPDGAIYIAAGGGTDGLLRLDPRTGMVTEIAPDSFLGPAGIAVSRDGKGYLADPAQGEILEVDLATQSVNTLVSEPPADAIRRLVLTADERHLLGGQRLLGDEMVTRIVRATGAASEFASLMGPGGPGILPSNALLVPSTDDDAVYRIGAAGSPVSPFSADLDFSFPFDLVIEPHRCRGRFPTVAGTNRSELLRGSRFADVILAAGGNDRVLGRGGKDLICGGKGRDRLFGGSGSDALLGGGQADRLMGGKGRDRLTGGKGRDRLRGGPGPDRERQ